MTSGRLARGLLVAIGTLSVSLGFLGVFLPLLPTTPFLLLAAYCYARGSPRLHARLLNNRWFGEYIKRWRREGSIPLKGKISALVLLAFSVGYSIVHIAVSAVVAILLTAVAVIVGLYIVTRPTART